MLFAVPSFAYVGNTYKCKLLGEASVLLGKVEPYKSHSDSLLISKFVWMDNHVNFIMKDGSERLEDIRWGSKIGQLHIEDTYWRSSSYRFYEPYLTHSQFMGGNDWVIIRQYECLKDYS